jgi:putative membrane protein
MMYGWWDYGASPPWYGMIFGPIMMIVFFVIIAMIIAWVLRAFGVGRQSSTEGKSTLDILKNRLARGEINRAEFEERRQLLSDS